ESGVDTSLVVRDVARRTPTLQRLCAGGRILARFDEGDIEPIAERTADVVCRNVERGGVRADAIVVSDYAYGVCQASVRERIASSRRPDVTLAVDARDLREWRPLDPTVVKPNRAEVGDLIGDRDAGPTDVGDAEAVHAHEQHLFGVTGARVVAVTLDRDGAVVLDRNGPPHRTYAHEARDNAAMGAGDTFLGAFTLAIAAGGDAATAAEVASHAA